MNSDRLFVYGTLMRDFDHPMAQLLSRSADFIGEARCPGRLYLVKHYPGMVLSDAADDVVFGELYRLKQPEALLRRRPDIRIAERELAAATARIGVAVALLTNPSQRGAKPSSTNMIASRDGTKIVPLSAVMIAAIAPMVTKTAAPEGK